MARNPSIDPTRRRGSPVSDVPESRTAAHSLPEIRKQAEHCRDCPLWKDAIQTVFGEGPEAARIVLVGEQPGDQEDSALQRMGRHSRL